ncbi:MAG: hypothetical protein ACR2HH_02190 [Chthoniobacterales bacterium]
MNRKILVTAAVAIGLSAFALRAEAQPNTTLNLLSDSSPAASPKGSLVGGRQVQFEFTQPAGRAVLVETSMDLADWMLWDVPGNSPIYPAVTEARTLVARLDLDTRRSFRLRLSTP